MVERMRSRDCGFESCWEMFFFIFLLSLSCVSFISSLEEGQHGLLSHKQFLAVHGISQKNYETYQQHPILDVTMKRPVRF